MKPLSNFLQIVIGGLAISSSSLLADEHTKEAYTGNDASIWIQHYGEDWFNHYAESFEIYFPGGKSNEYHEQYIKSALYSRVPTKDWTIFNRRYYTDGPYFACEWYYKATYKDDGFQQWESTLVIGKIKDGKLIWFSEWFDDSVGSLQRLHLLDFFENTEGEVHPWPNTKLMRADYRP